MKDKILEILHDAKCRSRIITITLQEVARRIATAIEQLEPEGAVCKRCQGTGYDGHDRCDPPNPYICEDCNGLGNSPPQQPSSSAGEEVYVECGQKDGYEFFTDPGNALPIRYFKKLTRPTVSEGKIDRMAENYSEQFVSLGRIVDAKKDFKAGFKAAIKELNR